MTAASDQISKLKIVAPKIIGIVGASLMAGLIAYRANQNFVDALISALGAFLTFGGYSLPALAATASLNPANVASASAVVPTAPGKANVTTDPPTS
jgi:hypothetical protein